MIEHQVDVEYKGNIYAVYGDTGIISATGPCGICHRECTDVTVPALTDIEEILNSTTQVSISKNSSTWQAVKKLAGVQYMEEMEEITRKKENKSSLLLCDSCSEAELENIEREIKEYETGYEPQHKL